MVYRAFSHHAPDEPDRLCRMELEGSLRVSAYRWTAGDQEACSPGTVERVGFRPELRPKQSDRREHRTVRWSSRAGRAYHTT